MSAVRHLQIAGESGVPFVAAPMARLEYVLKGIKRKEAAKAQGGRERLPITPPLLQRMKKVWEDNDRTDKPMLWAASCVCFFAFLRVGEMTVLSDSSLDPIVHLGVSDVAVDNPREPSTVRIRIKQSKTDPFRKGIDLFVGRTSSSLCPVAALLDYLRFRRASPGPLYQDGRALTRARFATEVRDVLKQAGVDESKYCTHRYIIREFFFRCV